LQKRSPCKVNLLLNILGKRPDGFHELETVMHPVAVYDELSFSRGGTGIQLSCNSPGLPTDSTNLVHRAAAIFLERAKIKEGIRIDLQKRVPVGGGLGGGSANAAVTLLVLNELYGNPLSDLHDLAAQLGSDVPFFLQSRPALATGRGEKIEPLDFFPALKGKWFLLIYPGFGVPTAWAYKHLEPPYGRPGGAAELIKALNLNLQLSAFSLFHNSLEAPVLRKYPLLQLFQEFLRANGALAALMSGSGSTTFAICADEPQARDLERKVQDKFGPVWTAAAPVDA
jgi:4-diphosphocytidyl-2-C-methyl-D-erythritol kinase